MNLEAFKQVENIQYTDEDGLEVIQEEFISCLKQCENEIVGSEQVGESIEFFDEDGAVLLVVFLDSEQNRAKFEFVLSEKVFDVSLNNIPEQYLEATV